MKKSGWVLLLLLAVWLAGPASLDAQQKLAQTGMKFLNVEPDPRAAAMGGAFTAVEGSSTSAFFNPAGTARIPTFADVFVGYTTWIADIKHVFGSVSFSPAGGEYGVLTLSAQSVEYGELEQTVFYNNYRGYLDLGTFSPSGLVLGLGYARALSEKFSVGGTVKYVSQSLGSSLTYLNSATNSYERSYYDANLYAFDFGVLYKTGFRSLTLGMCLRNFSKEARFVDEGFQLPLTFRIGFSMDAFDLMAVDNSVQSLLVAVDFEHPRDFQEQVKIGGEYLFMRSIAIRAGYVFPADEHGFSFGVGLRQSVEGDFGLGVDYSYTPFGVFGGVHRVSLSIRL
jgi:hypothetical protein